MLSLKRVAGGVQVMSARRASTHEDRVRLSIPSSLEPNPHLLVV